MEMKISAVAIKLGGKKGLKRIQCGICFLLCILSAGLGVLTFMLLRQQEERLFQATFDSSARLISGHIMTSLDKKISTSKLVNHLFADAIQSGVDGTLPNFTYPSFEAIMGTLSEIAYFRTVGFSPIINQTTRDGWEAYAAKNVDLLEGPATLTTSINGSWIVSDGIFNVSESGQTSHHTGYIRGSRFPYTLTPLWQIWPIATNAPLVMLDTHAIVFGNRREATDHVIEFKVPIFSDFLRLVQDGLSASRLSTLVLGPIQALGEGSPIHGIFSGSFTWNDLLSGILAKNYKKVDCVVRSQTRVFTFVLANGEAYFSAEGDLHDRKFERLAQSMPSDNDFNYYVTFYPTQELYDSYMTDSPRNICIIVVVLIALTSAIVFFYSCLVQLRTDKMTEKIKHLYAATAARDAILKSRKAYVRYMSHEMRTPLNIVYLGLKILEKDLLKSKVANYLEGVTTVRDIMSACDVTVEFLNDLLNFGKLEGGLLKLKMKKTLALPFIMSAIQFLDLLADEKGVRLIIDVTEFKSESATTDTTPIPPPPDSILLVPIPPVNSPKFERIQAEVLQKSEKQSDSLYYPDTHNYVDVDNQKLSQVIRNIVFNAVKFSEEGGTVCITARKTLPRFLPARIALTAPPKQLLATPPAHRFLTPDFLRLHSFQCTPPRTVHNLTLESSLITPSDFKRVCDSYCGGDSVGGLMEPDPPSKEVVPDHGFLVLEVTDSGCGMTADESRYHFSDDFHFDPRDFMAYNHRGLGLAIARVVVDLHGGEFSVDCNPKGNGCVFTLKIPMCSLGHQEPPLGSEIEPEVLGKGETKAEAMLSSNAIGDEGLDNDMLSKIIDWAHTTDDAFLGVQPLAVPKRQLNLLVVDDSSLNRRMLINFFKADCYVCDQAGDGVQAIQMVTERSAACGLRTCAFQGKSSSKTCFEYSEPMAVPPNPCAEVLRPMYDAILMDFMMPNMDGPTATKAIRELGYTGLILGITGNALAHDIAHFLESGADQVLLKPVHPEVLEAALCSVSHTLA